MLGCSCPCSITAAPGFALPRLILVLSHNNPHQEALMSAINGPGAADCLWWEGGAGSFGQPGWKCAAARVKLGWESDEIEMRRIWWGRGKPY